MQPRANVTLQSKKWRFNEPSPSSKRTTKLSFSESNTTSHSPPPTSQNSEYLQSSSRIFLFSVLPSPKREPPY
ncbi:hypothetical protein ERO13_A01G018550v2 [Gossypium hirsutum]|uniref:Uncharacterized protein n=1 Tax=Gossypium barbadense TaxID=3634 RepID=A0A5J5WUH9_GOSBA|nr:hypothetical protein ES319_A01G019700v1 [Gossypium barbadense]KAG4212943.1 hypothetical protein ERO13_A01G018550v2 [Gossypium hirsutum]